MWVVLGLVVGLLAVVGLLVFVALSRRGLAEGSPIESDMTAEQWTTLGIVFTGAGTAMTVTLGPFMVWMIALGVIYMAMGVRMKRNQPK